MPIELVVLISAIGGVLLGAMGVLAFQRSTWSSNLQGLAGSYRRSRNGPAPMDLGPGNIVVTKSAMDSDSRAHGRQSDAAFVQYRLDGSSH